MNMLGAFVAGVATGWVLRGSFDSFRGMAVRGVAATYELADRARRFVAVEKEYFEDLVAEGKARYEARKQAPQGAQAANVTELRGYKQAS